MESNDLAEALLAQREALVSFGRRALRSNDLEGMLTEACELTSEALGTDLAKIMKLVDSGQSLLVIAGTGWKDGVIGEEKVPALAESSEGYALKTGVPAVSPDIRKEKRFDYAEFLRQHDVKAMVNVVIPGPEGEQPFGLLQVDSQEERKFDQNEIQFLQGYANIIGAAIERHKYQDYLREALATQERLHAELLHRIKNNLAVISSILRLKSRQSDHPVVQQEISDVLARIQVLDHIYEQLHSSSNAEQIDLGGYLSSLCTSVISFTNQVRDRARINTSAQVALVSPQVAVPLGLVLTEFVTNSLKHATETTALEIVLEITNRTDQVSLLLGDNGPGLGDALDEKEDRSTGSGLMLIEGLLRQLNATWEWSDQDGTRIEIHVPVVEQLVREPI